MKRKVYREYRLLERAIRRNAIEMEVRYILGDIAEMEVNNIFKVNNNIRGINSRCSKLTLKTATALKRSRRGVFIYYFRIT